MSQRLRLGLVGCGDVAHRHYLPGIASRADLCRDHRRCGSEPPDAAAGVASAIAAWSPGARTCWSVGEMLAGETLTRSLQPDAPPRSTAPSTARSSRPASPASARSRSRRRWPMPTPLIDLAASQDVLFLVAPGSAAHARRCAGSAGLIDDGNLGRPTPRRWPTTPTPARRTGASITGDPDAVLTATASARSSTTASTGCTR